MSGGKNELSMYMKGNITFWWFFELLCQMSSYAWKEDIFRFYHWTVSRTLSKCWRKHWAFCHVILQRKTIPRMEGNTKRKYLNTWFHSKYMNWDKLFQKLPNLIKNWKWLSRLELFETNTSSHPLLFFLLCFYMTFLSETSLFPCH